MHLIQHRQTTIEERVIPIIAAVSNCVLSTLSIKSFLFSNKDAVWFASFLKYFLVVNTISDVTVVVGVSVVVVGVSVVVCVSVVVVGISVVVRVSVVVVGV